MFLTALWQVSLRTSRFGLLRTAKVGVQDLHMKSPRPRRIVVCASLISGLLPATGLAGEALANQVQTIVGRPYDANRTRQAAPGGRFRQLDTNRDGQISRREMEQGNQSRLQSFERADRNGDGELSQEEWKAFKGANKKRKANAL
jgi:EF hand